MPAAALGYVGRRRAWLGRLAATNWAIILCCLVPAGIYYAMLITLGFPSFFTAHPHGLTFNSMLLHLLNGTFDVDPQTIGDEGIVRNGMSYTYFGIVPALLRLPFLAFANFSGTDYTRLSCTVAALVMAAFNLASMLTVWRSAGRPAERSDLPVLLGATLVFAGPQVQFLRAIIFQEVLLWSAALASAFVFLVVSGCFSERGFTAKRLAGLAAIAGACLLTRVSTALGLYLALGLLMLVLAWRGWRSGRNLTAIVAPLLPAGAILCLFIALAGIINYGRWGNPLLFTDPQHYLWWLAHDQERLARYQRYGLFSLARLGFGLSYYFLPVWAIPTADGSLLMAAYQHATVDSVELPPSSFFISDPLLVGLTGFALVQLVKSRQLIDRGVALPVLAGLLVPIALILTYGGMSFRYRLEFYPLFDFCAFLGFGVLLTRPAPPPLRWFAVAAWGGLATAHLIGLLYMLTPLGNADGLLHGMNIVQFYLAEF
jgi:hypothetical protein